jgi:integrase
MPATKRAKPLYQRGDFRLYRRADREALEIVWYDGERKRERSASAGTRDDREARKAVDRLYLKATGQRFCEACGRPFDGDAAPLLTTALIDYLLLSEDKAGFKATRTRLGHVTDYLSEGRSMTTCAQIDDRWVNDFRRWLAAKPVALKDGTVLRQRSLGAIEGCVLQLAAAINATPGQTASFKAEQLKAVAASPKYRADVKMLAAMFRYALAESYRASLLAYLRIAVATWARPEEIFDVTKAQWASEARVLDLNPAGRRQTKKYRTRIPIPRQFAPFLDETEGRYMKVTLVRTSWEKMRLAIGVPRQHGEAGIKLIRRSMATIARKRIGEANWRQGEMMLGHVKAGISDIYALPDPANLGLALAATESIIDDIEKLAPGAFYRTSTANSVMLRVIGGSRNG